MDIKILYIEIYVTFLLAVIVYVLMELFKVEKEQAGTATAEGRPPIEFPRYSIWLVGIGMFLVIAGWLVSFPVNEAVKKIVASGAKAEKTAVGRPRSGEQERSAVNPPSQKTPAPAKKCRKKSPLPKQSILTSPSGFSSLERCWWR